MDDSIPRLEVDHLVSPRWLGILLLVALASVALHQVVIFFAGSVLLLALGLSWLWGRYCLDGLEYRRTFSSQGVGFDEEVTMSVTVVNRKPLPLAWLEVDDELPSAVALARGTLYTSWKARRSVLRNLLALRWYERVTRHYHLRCPERGEHRFGPVELRSGDLFGLARRTLSMPARQTLLVYPKVVPVEALDLPSRFPFGDERSPDRLHTDPLRMAGIRPYARGDSPRQMHWKASARLGSLQVKTYDPSATLRVMLLLNLRTMPTLWGGIREDLLELSICVAASLAAHLARERAQFGLAANGLLPHSRGSIRIAPSRAPWHLTTVLSALAQVTPLMTSPFPDLLDAERRRVPAGATLVLITGLLDEETLMRAGAYRATGHPVTLLLLGDDLREATAPGLDARWIGNEERWRALRALRVTER